MYQCKTIFVRLVSIQKMLQTNCQFAYFLQVAIACMCVYISSSLQSQLIWCDRTRCLIIIWHWCIWCPDLPIPRCGHWSSGPWSLITHRQQNSGSRRRFGGESSLRPSDLTYLGWRKKLGIIYDQHFVSLTSPPMFTSQRRWHWPRIWSWLTLMARVTCVKVPSLGRGHGVSLCRERGSERLRPVVTTSGDTHYRDHDRGGACRGSPTWRWP